jgi:hypothetical protein
MSSYISSSGNRLYTALEPQYGNAPAITAANRIPAVHLAAHQAPVPVRRRDKTGSRTFLGLPSGLRTEATFQLKTYMSSWTGVGQPAYGPLFQAAMGAAPETVSGLQVASAVGIQIQTSAAHGLSIGSAVSFGGEIRFVQAVLDAITIQLNAPFSETVPNGAGLASAVTYKLASSLPSVSIYDYWDPATAISRVITGAAVNEFQLAINGDFHEFTFSGPACDLVDSNTFSPGAAGLTSYPVEPVQSGFDYSIVPGHLGQVWLGSTPTQFFSLTGAAVKVSNNMQLRTEEYGASRPSGLVPGPRQVEVGFSLLAQDDVATEALYASAKTRVPVSAMLQLGQQQGRLMGIYIPNVTPEIPSFDDAELRLQWHFENCLAKGVSDDEIYVAFA